MTAHPESGDTAVIAVGPARVASEPIRVLVCVAHAHVLWGLGKLVEGEWPRLLLVATVSTFADAESYLRSHPTEVAVLDLPELSEEAFARVERLCRTFTTSFVMLDGEERVQHRLARAGVKTVLALDTPGEEILSAVYRSVGAPYRH